MGNWQNLPNTSTPLNKANLDALYDLRQGSDVIASNTDLNNLTTIGTFRSESATISASLSNCPHTSSAFKLIVEYLNRNDRIRQTIYANDQHSTTWVRTYNGSWSGWKQVGVISTKTGTATTNAGGMFNTYISRNHDILSVTVMKTAGTNYTRAEVYARNDQANQVVYVYDVSGNAVTNTEVEYRIKYIEN